MNQIANMAVAIVPLILALIFLPGIIILQIFLSRRDNKWLGLALPAIGVIVSLSVVLSIAVFHISRTGGLRETTYDENGNVIEVIEHPAENDSHSVEVAFLATAVLNFFIFNIPTVILLLIHFACREGVKKRLAKEAKIKELDKMSIQDLE